MTADGRVFVCDRESDRIQIFSPDGEYLSEWTDTQRPTHLVFDAAGREKSFSLAGLENGMHTLTITARFADKETSRKLHFDFRSGNSAVLSFAKDIQPIFEARCAKCHQTGPAHELETYEQWVAGVDVDSGLKKGRVRKDANALRFVEVTVNGPREATFELAKPQPPETNASFGRGGGVPRPSSSRAGERDCRGSTPAIRGDTGTGARAEFPGPDCRLHDRQ